MKKTAAMLVLLSGMTSLASADDYIMEHRSGYRALNTPVNYNYGELVYGQTDIDGLADDASYLTLSAQGMINTRWILSLSYQRDALDHATLEDLSHTGLISVLHRVALAEQLDMVIGAGAGWGEFTSENESTGATVERESKAIYQGQIGLRLGRGEVLDLEANAYIRSKAAGGSGETQSADVAMIYYFNQNFALGVRYHMSIEDDDGDWSTVAGVARFRF